MNNTIRTALTYAAKGWHVLPLRPNSKRPAIPTHTQSDCDRSDPLCINGHRGWNERATTDPAQIASYWASNHNGLAIATGPSNLVVIDIDTAKPGAHHCGFDSLDALQHATGQTLPPTFVVHTPSGGQHRYYRLAQGSSAPCTASRLGPGIDTRGRGGYIVAPPTRLTHGAYHVTNSQPAAPAPRWLLDQLTTTPSPVASPPGPLPVGHLSSYIAAAVEGETRRILDAPIGQRNNALFLAAIALGQLVGGGHLDEHHALDVLHHAARRQTRHHTEGFDARQSVATIQSGFRRGLSEPRQLQPSTS